MINFEEVVKNANEAYALLKQIGLEQPAKEAAIKFTSWFSSLFVRKLHKEKIALMEQLSANDDVLKMLKMELEALAAESEVLKEEIINHNKEYIGIRNSSEFKVTNSNVKNIVNAPISNVSGNINIGDNYNK